jgi:hypothetical protein
LGGLVGAAFISFRVVAPNTPSRNQDVNPALTITAHTGVDTNSIAAVVQVFYISCKGQTWRSGIGKTVVDKKKEAENSAS